MLLGSNEIPNSPAAGTCSLPRGLTSRTVRRHPEPYHVGAGHGWKRQHRCVPDLGNDSRHVLGVVGWNGHVE